MDEAELDRIDMCHAKYCALIGKQKYLAPISDPQKILDLGCGTGSCCPPFSWGLPIPNMTVSYDRYLVY
jgi:hypothetical protein